MNVAATVRRRVRDEAGFTLIELLVVLVIIGILLGIAIPSYLGFKDRANKRAAQANLRSALPAAEAFQVDNSTYAGMALSDLTSIDSGINQGIVVSGTTATSYCLGLSVSGQDYSVKGPGGKWYNGTSCAGSQITP